VPLAKRRYDAVAKLVGDLDAVLEREADGIERVVTTALVVPATYPLAKGESVRTGWRASRTSVVEIGRSRSGRSVARPSRCRGCRDTRAELAIGAEHAATTKPAGGSG